jgi:hypothetical protein
MKRWGIRKKKKRKRKRKRKEIPHALNYSKKRGGVKIRSQIYDHALMKVIYKKIFHHISSWIKLGICITLL